jgi:hypothetical protein
MTGSKTRGTQTGTGEKRCKRIACGFVVIDDVNVVVVSHDKMARIAGGVKIEVRRLSFRGWNRSIDRSGCGMITKAERDCALVSRQLSR